MKRKGIEFHRAKELGWRNTRDGDTYVDGSPIPDNYVVIVNISDCELLEKDGRTVYNADDAPPKQLTAHGRTNKAYGKRRRWKNKNYDTRAVYWVEDGYVYRGSIRIPMEPDDQPENGYYDAEGRYYVKYRDGIALEHAKNLEKEITADLESGRRWTITRRVGEEGDEWDLYVHASLASKINII